MDIRIIGDIDSGAYARFSEELTEAEGNNEDVFVELMSPGGDAYSALAFYSRMRNSNVKITLHVTGIAASAAILLLAGANHVIMDKDAWLMVHEDSGKISGDVVSLERESAQMRRMENQWVYILSENSKLSAAKWTQLHKVTTYLNAKQALKTGLVDEVL